MTSRPHEVFVDTGAWIALASVRDSFHQRAVLSWAHLEKAGTARATSVPVVMETFTFLERNTTRETALLWKQSIAEVSRLRVLDVSSRDLSLAWAWFERKDLHRLSAVDATSFVVMKREKIRTAFTYDHHFSSAGFRVLD